MAGTTQFVASSPQSVVGGSPGSTQFATSSPQSVAAAGVVPHSVSSQSVPAAMRSLQAVQQFEQQPHGRYNNSYTIIRCSIIHKNLVFIR